MCGIAGYTGEGNRDVLNNMILSIKHRGPDFQDTYTTNELGLAHARLSILDLSPEANQPMFSSDKKIVITFNGEIYNYLPLKKELEKKYKFQSTSDTEVLIYLYKEYGTKMLDKINGMFAFAIYDFDDNILFLSKDRMGKKPLYYSCSNNSFVFGSELKSLLQHPSIKKELNIEAVNQYLTFDYVPTPNSIIKNVFKLEPGHFLIVKNNTIIQHDAYWESNFSEKEDITLTQATEELDELLNDATYSRLMSDVPLGVFLSGGLDSSAIAYYAQKNSKSSIKTFSIGFDNKSYDETDYANRVAKHLGTDHYSKILTPENTLELIDEIYPNIDEPFADASLIPTHFLSKFTREHVTVALGGDGSDELFSGYPTFISDKFKWPLANLSPKLSKTLFSVANSLLPSSDKNISFDFKVKQFLRGFVSNENHIHQLWLGSFNPDEKSQLFNSDIYTSLQDKSGLSLIDQHFSECNQNWSDSDKITNYYYKTYLLDDILVKVDRASMLNSLEVRAPFLDKNIVEFANKIPDHLKIKGITQGKYILKKTMEGKLPDDIIYRNKKGFGIPLSDWIRKDLKSIIHDVLLSKDSYFNSNYIAKILDEHQKKKRNHRKLIWNLFLLKHYMIENQLN